MSRSTQYELEVALSLVDEREREFQIACEEDAEAEHAYKMRQAKEYLAAEGTEKAREATSRVACEREHLDHLRKKAVKEFTREKLRDAQSALSARQSLLNFDAKTNFGYVNQT